MKTKEYAVFHIVLVKGWVEKASKLLLAQRDRTELHKPGVWSLPGGKVEICIESHILQNTLKQEIKEEVGMEIQGNMELIYNNFFRRADNAHVVNLTFLCHWKSCGAKPLEDTSEVCWFSVEELKDFSNAEPFLQIEINELVKYLQRVRKTIAVS